MHEDEPLNWGSLFPWLLFDYYKKPKIEFAGIKNSRHSLSDSEISMPLVLQESFFMICISDIPNDFVHPETGKRMTLGEMFPAIPDQASLFQSDSPDLSNSTKNLLLKHGWNKFYEFSGVYPSDISKLSGGGKKFARQLLATLAFEAVKWSSLQGSPDEVLLANSQKVGPSPSNNLSPELERQAISDFSFLPGNTNGAIRLLNEYLFKLSLLEGSSDSIFELLIDSSNLRLMPLELKQMKKSVWFAGANFEPIGLLLQEFLSTVDEKERYVLLSRASLADPVTLDLVGEKLGVTRERVRQMQSNYRKDFRTFIYGVPTLSAYYEVFLESFVGFTFVENLKKRLPFLADSIEGTKLEVIDFFVHMTHEYDAFDGIISDQPKTKFLKGIRVFLDEISNDEEIHDLSYFHQKFTGLYSRMDERDVESILRLSNFTHLLGFWLNNKASGVQDLAVAVLESEGKQLTPEEILAKIGLERNINSFKNALLVDPRIQRTGLGKFGLRSWGLPVYTSIGDSIGEFIDLHGSTHIEQLVIYLTTTFDVTPSSVRTYASSYPFEIVNGYVKRTNIKAKARKPVQKVKKVFRDGDSWLIRIAVTQETLRGSGTSLPTIFSEALGVSNKETKTFEGLYGPLIVTFPSLNLTISSIKTLCEEVGAVDGDFVFLSFVDNRYDFWKVDLQVESTRSKILELVGKRDHRDSVDLISELRKRLSLEPSESREEIRALVEKRKETELLALLDTTPDFLS